MRMFQALDLTVNKFVKACMKRISWSGIVWVLEVYNYFTSTAGNKIIVNFRKAAGNTDAIKIGSSPLGPLNPLFSIDTLD